MDKIQAQNLVKETFENSFDKQRFARFIKELLNFYEDAPFVYRGNIIPDAYDKFISSFERVGKYFEGENEIDILIVNLKKEVSLERARTAQRNFIAWYLNGARGGKQKDGALVAFVSPNSNDWRFSLVKMDYKIEDGGKVKQDFTPARRWSFLVGANENSHTAQSKLWPIIVNDQTNPTLSELEEAFSVEKVAKEFFEEYRKLFEILHGELAQNHTFLIQAERFGIGVENFAKKLLGQLIFIYFLQKKGWLGAQKDKPLNFGDKNFLTNLFLKKYREYANFFNDILEPLFYGALNKPTDKAGNFWRDYFSCQIPFLNGGLFEAEYKWEETNIYLDNKIFENILAVFDRYNFTVKEDEPLEKEVAIDPEMLGKVFENLLHENLRKGKGTYYTPRAIVYYMCRQSLINYLSAVLPGNEFEQKIIKFVNGETIISEEEMSKIGNESDMEVVAQKILIFSKNEARAIDKSLANIKICDPACGSGAFLVGMLNEIVRMRKFLDDWHLGKRITEYQLKKETIQNCVYGVDIDPGAIEIAKLRLWLALVVDYELAEIEPLPNLDYRLMCGNSLLEEYDGIKFCIDEQKNPQGELFGGDKTYESKIALLKTEIKNYFNIHSDAQKISQRKIINDLKDWFIDFALEARTNQLARELKEANEMSGALSPKDRNKFWENHGGKQLAAMKLQELKKDIHNPKKEKPFFLWKLEFSDVFSGANPGFDIVIANPPYVNVEKIDVSVKKCINYFKTAYQKYDLYVLFYEKSISLLKQNGILTFISSNKFLSQGYGFLLRQFFLNFKIDTIINFNFNVFETAIVRTCIFQLSKKQPTNNTIKIIDVSNANDKYKFLEEKYSYIAQNIFKNTEENNFRINLTTDKIALLGKIANNCLRVDSICSVNYGLRPSSEKLNHKKDYFIKNNNPKGLYKKYFEGKDMGYWRINKFSYLDYRPDVMYNPMFIELFKNKKLVGLRTLSDIGKLRFIYDDDGLLCNDSVVVLTLWHLFSDVKYSTIRRNITKEKISNSKNYSNGYLQAILNSRLIKFYVNELLYDGTHFYPDHMKQLPIKIATVKQQKPFVEIVDKILAITKSDDYLENAEKQAKVRDYETQIDPMVYRLYGLTPEEIKVIKGSS